MKPGGESWAWTLYPKAGTAGPQPVAVSLGVYRNVTGTAIQVPSSQKTEPLSIDVVRPFLDKYSGVLNSLILAGSAMVAAAFHLFTTKVKIDVSPSKGTGQRPRKSAVEQ